MQFEINEKLRQIFVIDSERVVPVQPLALTNQYKLIQRYDPLRRTTSPGGFTHYDHYINFVNKYSQKDRNINDLKMFLHDYYDWKIKRKI